MAVKRTLLLADPDLGVLRSLKNALEDEYDVVIARDGSKALELSVLRYPDLILFDRRCPLIGATQFMRILRTNPRTEEIPLTILSDRPLAQGVATGLMQGVLIKPLNLDEVRSHIAGVLHRVDTVKQVGEEGGAVSGSLEQVSMLDLLQLFSLNRRSGVLQLSQTGKGSAEIFVHDGRIEEALTGHCRGEKALYRILRWEKGRFTFVAARRSNTVSMSAATDNLLMEGMRQADELQRVRSELPARSATLERLVAGDALPEGLHPVTAEILNLVEFYPRVSDLVDRAQATDLEVHLAMRSLLEAGLVRAVEEGSDDGDGTLVSQEDVFDLRTRLRRAGLSPTYMRKPKVALLAADASELQLFVSRLVKVPGFVGANLTRTAEIEFGTLGTLQLEQSFGLEFFAMSWRERMLPLAYGLSAGTVAAIVVGTNAWDTLAPAVHLLEIERRASLIVLRRPEEPDVSTSSRATVVKLPRLDDDTTRRLLVTLVTQVAGQDDLRGVQL